MSVSFDAASSRLARLDLHSRHSNFGKVFAALGGNGAPSSSGFDYDLVIIGAGVGGHGAALHAVEKVNLIACNSLFSLFRWFFFVVNLFAVKSNVRVLEHGYMIFHEMPLLSAKIG